MSWRDLVNRCGIQPTESGQEYNARAVALVQRAKALSVDRCGTYAELNHWMRLAKAEKMSWPQGLYFSIDKMEDRSLERTEHR